MRLRVVLPFVCAAVCLFVAYMPVSPVVTWVMIIATFCLLADGITIIWPRGDNLTKYHQ